MIVGFEETAERILRPVGQSNEPRATNEEGCFLGHAIRLVIDADVDRGQSDLSKTYTLF